MTTLHGNWLIDPEGCYFFLWGETWRIIEGEIGSAHPFCSESGTLIETLGKLNFKLDSLEEKIVNINLPSYSPPRKKTFLPLLSDGELDNIKSLQLKEWRVTGIGLEIHNCLKFLEKLPLGESGVLGKDLKFWSYLQRWCLDLLVRSKFLPGIEKGEARWYPLLDSTIDRTRLAEFIGSAPPVCSSYLGNADVRVLILDFIAKTIDSRVRNTIDPGNISPSLTVKSWFQAAARSTPRLSADETTVQRLETACNNWVFPLRENLVTAENRQLLDNQYRLCLSLEPPGNGSEWRLIYQLQALDKQDFLIPAATLWREASDIYERDNRIIKNPQEILLKGLGLAGNIYKPIENSLEESEPGYCTLDPIQVYEFVRAIGWQLQDRGLGIILPKGLSLDSNARRLGVKVEANVIPQKGERLNLKSLLNFQLKLVVGDRESSKTDFDKILAKKSPFVEVGGEWLMLQPNDVKAARAMLDNTVDPINLSVEDALRLSSGDNNIIAKLPVVSFESTGVLKELIDTINNNQSIAEIETPKTFQGQLRPYQLKGISWLAFLEKWGLGACLADDMGLGKTPQLIAFLLHLKERDLLPKPVLVVCPTSVVNNWEKELKKFAPSLSVTIHHGDKRLKGKTFLKVVNEKNVVITSYPLVGRDESTLEAVEWGGVVLDEAQNIKNPSAKQSGAVRKLKADFKIALTGTPVENRLSELWSILDFLNPNFLGKQAFFQRRFAIPIEKYGDRSSLDTLRSLVRPFILRRLKTDKKIIQDLPEKQEMNVFCGLSSEQADIYQKLVSETLEKIEASEGIQRRGLILTLLMQLKQVCNHPGHFLKESKLDSSQRSGKLLRLEEMLEEVVAEGDRALIFTQFAEWGKLLQPYIQERLKREVLFLYGATKQKDRVAMIDRFQNDPDAPPIFILSLKAGGTGLNLTRANHVFHVDRWWNPAVENQATDRAFRIGQKRDVQVHKFISTGTLEEKINDIIESKKQLAEQTVDAGENWLTELDTDRLRDLLILDRNAIIDNGE